MTVALGYTRPMGSQWKQKHRLAAADARGRLFGRLAKEIAIAARNGADPDMNATLRMAIDAARKQSMPRDTLERAIKKGAGIGQDAVTYELVTYEGFAPHQVPVIVECLTDNRNRTATNIRVHFNKGGGQLGSSGAVAWDFDRRGIVAALPPEAGDDADEAAIECGADDLQPGDEGATHFLTDPAELSEVAGALEGRGWQIESAKLGWISKSPKALEGEALAEVEAFLERLDGDDDVQEIYVGLG